jgi:hypothetical protein
LDGLSGVHAAVQLRVGDAAVLGEEIPGPDEPGPSERTASVHFLRFTLDEPMREALAAGTAPVSLVIDHPGYVASATLDDQQRQQLVADLTSA